jgi:hypothetical protein
LIRVWLAHLAQRSGASVQKEKDSSRLLRNDFSPVIASEAKQSRQRLSQKTRRLGTLQRRFWIASSLRSSQRRRRQSFSAAC